MSEKNKGISPFKDPAFLKGSEKLHRTKVSSKEIDEFRNAFSDDENTKHFSSLKENNTSFRSSEKTESVSEDLYAVQSIDIDAFIESLTNKNQKNEKTKNTVHKVRLTGEEAKEKTRSFNLNDSFKRKATDSSPLTGEEKNIKKNVRVLVKSKQSDRHILEKVIEEEEKTNIIDILSADKGEDIFDAVDKAVTKNRNSAAFTAAMEKRKKSAKKKRENEALLTGKALKASLIKQSSRQKLQLLFCIALFPVTLLLTLLPSVYEEGNALEFMFSSNGRIFGIINCLIPLLLVAVLYKSYLKGIKSIISLSPNNCCALFTVTFFVFLNNVINLVLGSFATKTHCYTCFAVFTAAACCLGDYFNTRTALGALTTVMKAKALKSVQPIEVTRDAIAVAKGITDNKNPNILYSTEIEIGDSLTEGIGPRHSEGKFYSYCSAAVIILGGIFGLAGFITDKNISSVFTLFMSTVCFCSPVTVHAACSVLNYITNYKLHREGAAATNNEAIRLVGKAHGVAMDISDIFTAEVSSFRIVPGVFMKKNTAAAVACAVLMNSDTLIGDCFKDFLNQTKIELPVTENLQYEERLGFSAWVAGKRVLVGNREMLIEHSIPAPDEREERHYAGSRFVMYLAIEGKLIASFLVNYKVLSSVKKLTDEFNKTGLILILTSKEPFLDYKETAKRLSIESAAIKILSGKSEEIIRRYRQIRTQAISNGLVCSKSGNGLLSLIIRAYNLYTSDKFLFNIHLAGQVIALLLLILALSLNMPLFFSPFTIIFLELIWSICAYIITSQKTKF